MCRVLEAETLVYVIVSTGLKTFLVYLLLYLTHLLPLKKSMLFFFNRSRLSGSDDVHNTQTLVTFLIRIFLFVFLKERKSIRLEVRNDYLTVNSKKKLSCLK